MLGLELDLDSKSTKELIEIKSGEKNIYKVYLAAKMFCEFAKENLLYMNQS